MASENIFLSIIIPSYNETENLKRGVLGEVRDYLKKQKYSWEVIVAEDESPDLESRMLAKEFCETNKGFMFLQNEHGGKAKNIWEGIKRANGDLTLFSDMDQSTPIGELAKLLPYFDQGADIVIGSRGMGRKNFDMLRQIASTIFRTFRMALLPGKITDTQAGFKCLKTKIAKEIFPMLGAVNQSAQRSKGWTVTSFDVELLTIAQIKGYKIVEVPISWEDRDQSIAKAKERQQGKFVKESLDMAKEVLRVKYNLLAGKYKK